MDAIFFLTVLSGLIAVLLSGTTYYNGRKKAIEAEEATKLLMERTNEVAALQRDLLGEMNKNQEKTDLIVSLQTKLQEINEKLQGQTIKLENISTGGDSYLKMSFVKHNDKYKIWIQNMGDYPLSETTMWFMDLNHFDKLSDIEKVQYERRCSSAVANLGYFYSKGRKIIRELDYELDRDAGVRVVVNFSANNGTWRQVIRMKWVNGKWVTANKFMFDPFRTPDILYEIPEDYPSLSENEDIF